MCAVDILWTEHDNVSDAVNGGGESGRGGTGGEEAEGVLWEAGSICVGVWVV